MNSAKKELDEKVYKTIEETRKQHALEIQRKALDSALTEIDKKGDTLQDKNGFIHDTVPLKKKKPDFSK